MKLLQHAQALLLVACLALGITALPSRARADCFTTIAAIQSDGDGTLLVYFSASWHLIANAGHPALKDRLSLLLAAFLAGRDTVIKYPDEVPCTTNNYAVEATAVRLK